MSNTMGPDDAASNVLREIEERVRSRLALVERQNERLQKQVRLLGLGLVVAAAVLALVAVAPDSLAVVGLRQGDEVFEARGFRLVASDGVRRGEWWIDEDGRARLSMLDQQGRPRLNVTVLESGSPGISLVNSAGGNRVVLGVLDETATLVFADNEGIPRAVLGLTREDAANLVFADADGITRLGLGLDGSGMGTVMLPDSAADEGDASTESGGR
jgi:hypothetical protein